MNKWHIDQLTIEEKIGQMMMVGFDALTPNDHIIDMIEKLKIGNVILFARNVQTPEQLFILNQNLQKLAMTSIGIPLFISIDQEGGMVTRIFNGATFFPGAMTIAATKHASYANQLGDIMGEELLHLGINMNLAPVLDVNNNPKNPVIGVRSFGDDPHTVATFGMAMIKGIQKHIIAVGKHFPGHGDTHTDSHMALPTVEHDLERLQAVELVPFKKAIQCGLKGIMSSHINFPALTEAGRPTTLSKNVMTGLLREQLQFEGLIVSDCMQMKGIQNHYTTPEACVMAIDAGINIVCVSHSKDLQTQSYFRLLEAAKQNLLPTSLIDERVARILKFKKDNIRLHLNQSYAAVQPHIENEHHRYLSYHVVKKAATLVKGNPLKLGADALLIAILPMATTIADEKDAPFDFIQSVKEQLPQLESIISPVEPSDEDILRIIETAKSHQQIIMTSYNANIYQQQLDLINRLHTLDKEVHIISMRNPYDLHLTNVIKHYVCLYENTPNAMKVLLEYLKGDLKLEGKVPIHV